ncbi:MAG: hypothetical protein ACRDCN_09085 [Tannerellaceae bacterium]
MKTNYKHLLLILSLVLAVGCTKQTSQTDTSDTEQLAVITGTILNRDLYPNQKTVKLLVPFFTDTETQCESLIDKDNTFSFTFNPYMLRTVSIETFVSHLLIAPGDTNPMRSQIVGFETVSNWISAIVATRLQYKKPNLINIPQHSLKRLLQPMITALPNYFRIRWETRYTSQF